MTSFVAWVGVDARGPSSIYLASDSRISWQDPRKPLQVWDFGRKVFAATSGPHLFGYVGDVLFPSLILGELASAIDTSVLFQMESSAASRFALVSSIIKEAFGSLPSEQKHPFSIAYATRDAEGLQCEFSLWVLHWATASQWRTERLPMPDRSSSIAILGSGKRHVDLWEHKWRASDQADTSRAVFSAFSSAIRAGGDRLTGGPPQLVGLYRKKHGRTFGIATGDGAFVFGLRVPQVRTSDGIEWRNETFERVGPDGLLLPGAQKHHVPDTVA